MKKSVIILILIIYIGSIVFVGFFGMKMVSYNPTVQPERIECINSDMKLVVPNDENGQPVESESYKSVRLRWEEGLQYQLEWRVYPDNASQKAQFIYTSEIATIDENGLVTFSKHGTLTFSIACEEFGTVLQRVKIMVIKI